MLFLFLLEETRSGFKIPGRLEDAGPSGLPIDKRKMKLPLWDLGSGVQGSRIKMFDSMFSCETFFDFFIWLIPHWDDQSLN